MANKNEIPEWKLWKAGNNGAGRRNWFVLRYLDGPGTTGEALRTKRGSLIRFGSHESANKKATELNANT